MTKARRKDGKKSRKTVLRSVVKNGAGDNYADWVAWRGVAWRGVVRSANDEGKAQRRQKVAKNGLDLGAWRGVDSLS